MSVRLSIPHKHSSQGIAFPQSPPKGLSPEELSQSPLTTPAPFQDLLQTSNELFVRKMRNAPFRIQRIQLNSSHKIHEMLKEILKGT